MTPREADAYSKLTGVPKAAATERLEVERKGSEADIVGELEEGLGEGFAGVWFDREAGEFVVPLATGGKGQAVSESCKAAAAQEVSAASPQADYRTVAVRCGWGQLEAAQAQLDQELSGFFEEQIVQTSLDPRVNAVVIHVREGAAEAKVEAIRGLAQGAGVEVMLRETGAAAFEAGPQGCDEVTYAFETPDWRPDVTTEGHSLFAYVEDETGKSDLKGTVNPKGFATKYHFEWGDQEEFEAEEFNHSSPEVEVGNCICDEEIEQTIEGLKGKTTYHYRLVAENVEGSSTGESDSFETLNWRPKVGRKAIEVGREEATMWAKIDPEGFATTYRFEWGNQEEFEAEEYNNVFPVPDGEIAGSEEPVVVTHSLEGLEQRETYHFRVVAENADGAASGLDKSFTTDTSGFVFEKDELYGEGALEVRGEGLQDDVLIMSNRSYGCYLFESEASVEGDVEVLAAMIPTYEECVGFGDPIVNMGSCTFTLDPGPETAPGEFAGTLDIGPAECGPIILEATTNSCSWIIAPQTDLGPVTYTNEGEGYEAKVRVEIDQASFEYTAEGSGLICGSDGLGTLSATWELSALPETEEPRGMHLNGLFRVAPEATTGEASDLEGISATLNGSVDPNLLETTYQFQYATEADYDPEAEDPYAAGGAIPAEPDSVGDGEDGVAVQQAVEGLAPNTTYHYRVIASNAEGTTHGGDETFTTTLPHQPRFESEAYPAILAGVQDPEEKLLLTRSNRRFECGQAHFWGQADAASPTLSIQAEYGECFSPTLGENSVAEIDMSSCRYELSALNAGPPYAGEIAIACAEEGDAIELTLYSNQQNKEAESPLCVFEIGAQEGLGEVGLATTGEGSQRGIDLDLALEGIASTRVQGPAILCGALEDSSATYEGRARVHGWLG